MNPSQATFNRQSGHHAVNPINPSFQNLQSEQLSLIEPTRTIRPSKNIQLSNGKKPQNQQNQPESRPSLTNFQKNPSLQPQTNYSLRIQHKDSVLAQNSSSSIPSTYQSDILWKTEISESFISKLEEFESTELPPKNPIPNKQYKNAKNMKNLQKQVQDLRLYTKEMNKKIVEMHKIYSQGNKKSIELVMLIVRQLEKQNQTLKQKISMMNLLEMSRSIRTLQTENSPAQQYQIKQEIDKIADTRPFDLIHERPKQSICQNNALGSQISQPDEKLNTKSPLKDPSKDSAKQESRDFSIEGSPVWSVLLTGDRNRLETIQELEHDDDSYSLNEMSSIQGFQNLLSPKLGGSARLSDFSNSHISPFHLQNYERPAVLIVEKNYAKQKKHIQNEEISVSYKESGYQNESSLDVTLKVNETSQNFVSQDDEEQSLIVKKLLKLKKIHKKPSNSSQNSNSQISCDNSRNLLHKTQENKQNDPFSSISLSHLSGENQNSITQALSILKEYSSSNESLKIWNLSSDKEKQEKKVMKTKFPQKISILAGKKTQNKENVPL